MVQVYSSMAGATSSIPIEIMALIFQLSLPDLPDRYHKNNSREFQSSTLSEPLKLGAVCKRWRDIAWSTPFLWSTLAISIDLSNNPEHVELVEEWLSRSKALPLRITLILESFAKEEYDDYEPLLAVIAETACRWHYLDAHMPWEFITNLCNIAEEIPIIHTLGLHVTDDPSFSTTAGHLLWDEETLKPSPKKLIISKLPLKALNINWGSVTEVDADSLLFTDCINILRSSPNLESCKFSEVFEYGFDMDTSNPGPGFVHENLRCLSYNSEDPSDAHPDFFLVVTLPNLIQFSYESWVTAENLLLMDFFTRSAFPLLKLEMTFAFFEYEDLRHLFQAASSIRHLHLFPLRNEEFEIESLTAAPLLREFAQASGPDLYEGEATPLLPCLESLKYGLYYGSVFPWSLVPDMFGSPSTFSSPNRRPLKVLKVVNQYGGPEYDMALKAIPKDVLPKLLELRQAGADITYINANNTMDLFAMSVTFHDQELRRMRGQENW